VRISVIGCGYVGLVTGTGLAEAGHQVICTDNDPERIAALKAGVVPIYEPYLDVMLAANRRALKISFTSDTAKAHPGCVSPECWCGVSRSLQP
jgi:UDPglucose 6-dehydrogenase